MAVSLSKKKSKKSYKKEEERGLIKSCLFNFLSRIPVTLLFIIIIFIWSSSTTIISGSIFHVCVTSRKLNNLYCLSAGAQPSGFDIPLISNSSEFSAVQRSTNLVLNNSQKAPVFSPVSLLTAAENTKNSASEEKTEGAVQLTRNTAVINPIRDSIDIQLPVVNDGSTKELMISSQSSSLYQFSKPVLRKGIGKEKAEEIANARKNVEEQLATLRTYIAKEKPLNCEGRGIYVYDLPSKFNKDLLAKCNEMMSWLDFCKYFTNGAMGEPMPELGEGWYNTYQYSLEPIFHNRVLKHPCRVHNAEEAKLFFVPFYGGMDILRWHFNKAPINVKDSLSEELVEWLEPYETWRRNFGLDHVFVLGKISWDFRRWENVSWGSRLLELDELQNPMKLLIERQPWHPNDVGIPHPTNFHPKSDEEIIAWQEKIKQMNRMNLISFAGAPRRALGSIRSVLIEQCASAPRVCNFLDCGEQKCADSAAVMKLFMESEFCLQPAGDSPTRKSVFDALIAGCIPVVFDPFTAHYQYPWHLPEDHRKYSVYLDQEEVKMSEMNVVNELLKIPLVERQQMRNYIIEELMPRLVYAHEDAKLTRFDDAFTLSVNNLLERAVSRLS
ncbi:xyloglucan-specific galacturonosyltransferase 1-like isoform X2 [Chenopodium quinoa]|uniref:Exostosin GT47 domain-containing protein n=1 Tax=Chenopodium quinoa TaxID=63459 RepID=A0A803LQJ9_CHEQI|nr:xyloglucan-specific galacturonosyltransferase 1-like isoform X2 [Chenopodium quinoa]